MNEFDMSSILLAKGKMCRERYLQNKLIQYYGREGF